MPPTIRASKATVEAKSISKGARKKYHQTNTHNAQSHVAKGDVKITVNKQYPSRDGNKERLPEGTVVHGDKAIISSRSTNITPVNKTKRVRGVFKDNVIIDYGGKSNSTVTKTKGNRTTGPNRSKTRKKK